MLSKLFFIISFLASVGLALNKFGCSSPDEFEKANLNLKTKVFSSLKDKKSKKLHSVLFEQGEMIGTGAFGEIVKVNIYNQNMIIKKVEAIKEWDKEDIRREVRILKEICENQVTDVKNLPQCKSHSVVSYYGCVEEQDKDSVQDKYSVYIFQEEMDQDLEGYYIQTRYRGLGHLLRAKVMLDIIDKFIELHQLKVVHSDIKPENIMMKGKEFTNYKIIDFGVSNYEGDEYIGGTPGYLCPERYEPDSDKRMLSYNEDVFSLAITLAELEGDFKPALKIIEDGCFEDKQNLKKCEKDIESGLNFAFSEKKGLRPFLPVFKKAVSVEPENRFQTMKEFSLALLQQFTQLENAEKFANKILTDLKSQEPNKILPGFWKDQLPCLDFTPKGMIDWFIEVFNNTLDFLSCKEKMKAFDPSYGELDAKKKIQNSEEKSIIKNVQNNNLILI